MPRPRRCSAPSTSSTRTTPLTAASAIAARGSRQFDFTACLVQRQASRVVEGAACRAHFPLKSALEVEDLNPSGIRVEDDELSQRIDHE